MWQLKVDWAPSQVVQAPPQVVQAAKRMEAEGTKPPEAMLKSKPASLPPCFYGRMLFTGSYSVVAAEQEQVHNLQGTVQIEMRADHPKADLSDDTADH